MTVTRSFPRLVAAGTALLVALPLTVGATAPAVASTGVQQAGTSSYIVTLKGSLLHDAAAGSQAAERAGEVLTGKYGGTVTHVYGAALNGFSARLGADQAERLSADSHVDSVQKDAVVRIADTQKDPRSWGLDRIDQPSLPLDDSYSYPHSSGSGVTAYVIDTGVRVSHADFGGRASYGYDFVDNDASAQDGNGHGTHVAGTIAGQGGGVAKHASVVAVRVLDDFGSGTASGVIAGIDWVTAHARKPAVANMSVSGTLAPEIDTAVRNSIATGIVYTVAAGNQSADASRYSPSGVREAITVGATNRTDGRAAFSNYGSAIDLFAPGMQIVSDWATNDSSTHTESGTSMASPHVAGAVAVYLAGHPGATPAQVAAHLRSAAAVGKLSDIGAGSPNLLLQVTG